MWLVVQIASTLVKSLRNNLWTSRYLMDGFHHESKLPKMIFSHLSSLLSDLMSEETICSQQGIYVISLFHFLIFSQTLTFSNFC